MTEPDNLPPALADRLREIGEEMRTLHKRIEELAAERALRISTAAICREAWYAPPENEPPSTNAHGLTPEWHAPPVQEARKRRTPTEIREAVLAKLTALCPKAYTELQIVGLFDGDIAKSSVVSALAYQTKAGAITLISDGTSNRWFVTPPHPAAVSAAKPPMPEGSDPVPPGPPQEAEEAADG